VWLLNSDTLLKPNTIQTLVDVVEENGVEIASCKLLNNDGTIQQQGGYLPNLLNLFAWMLFLDDIPLVKRLFKPYQQRNRGFFRKNQKVGWLGGTALLVKRDLYNKMGGLDEKIFMYGEDVDFAIRAKKMGVPIYYFSEPSLTHLGQASGSSKGAVIGEFKGLKYVYRKHKSWPQLLILRTLLKIGALMRILVFGYLIGDKERKDVYSEAFKVA
jgi:hypothetical protein